MKPQTRTSSFLLVVLLTTLALLISACQFNVSRNGDGSLTVTTSMSQQELQSEISAAIADPLRVLHDHLGRAMSCIDVICVEDLHVRGMVRNHCLARSLSDAALGQVVRLLEYKCHWYGKDLIKVDRFYPSSKTCSACGHVLEDLSLSVREWTCPTASTSGARSRRRARTASASPARSSTPAS